MRSRLRALRRCRPSDREAAIYGQNSRNTLFDEEVAQQFFDNTVLVAQLKQLTSNEHFSVDGTPLEAAAVAQEFSSKGRARQGAGSNPVDDYARTCQE